MFSSRHFYRQQFWMVVATYLFIISVLAVPALSATASEFLEKGIYNEETVGDLDKAIEAYQKVLEASKESINSAAEAQFRIGACLAKQGKSEEASEAFQAVIDNYPKAEDWVAQAKSRLPQSPELLPVPWGDGDELQLELKLPTGLSAGHQVFRIGKVVKDGQSYWESSNWQTVTLNNMRGKSRVLVDFETFAPIESEWKHTMLGDAKATYDKEKTVIKFANGKDAKTVNITGKSYDNEQAAQMFRRLPLKVGANFEVEVVTILVATKVPLTLKTLAIETIEVPAGKFECFRLYIEGLDQTFWISNDKHRYIVRFAAGGVTADLIKIRKFKPHQSVEIDNENYALTLPSGWYAHTPEKSKNEDKMTAFVVTPNPSVNARIHSTAVDKVRKKYGTAREWMEWALSDNPQHMQDFKIDEQGIQAVTLGKGEGVQVEYTFTANGTPLRAKRILAFGETAAFDVRFAAGVDELSKIEGEIQQILSNLQVK